MSRLDALKIVYEEKMNDLFSYSGNYLLTVPKKGYEKEWSEAKEITDVLKDIIDEAEE